MHGGAALAAARALKDKLDGRSVAEAARALGQGEAIEVSAKFDATAEDHGACAHAIEVTVDVETGTVRVLSAMLAVDVGQVINPVGLRGQLEGLAADCEEDGVYEFFFSAPPLPFTGGVGSPVNPLAVK